MKKRKKMFHINTIKLESFVVVFVWIISIEFFIFLFDTYIKQSLFYYSDIMCVMDYINISFDSYIFQLFVYPYTAILLSILSDNFKTANNVIRYVHKKQIVFNIIIRCGINAFVCSIFLIISLVALGGLFSIKFFNWNETFSYFYMSNLKIIDINNLLILLYFFFKSFVPLSFFSIVIILFQNFTKKVYSYIAVILLCIINLFDRIEYVVSKIGINIQLFNNLVSVNTFFVYFIGIPILIIIGCYLSFKTVVKKDYFCE